MSVQKIKKVIALSYYHPWIAGGGHRPHQLALADLLEGKDVVFIFSNKTDFSDIEKYINREEYKNLLLYFYNDGVLESVNSPTPSIKIEEFTQNFMPDYVRAHNPAQEYLPYIGYLKENQKIFLYDQMDDWQCFASQPWGGLEVELEYINRSDLISTITNKLAQSIIGKKVLVSPNAIRDDLIKLDLWKTENYKEKASFKKHVIYAGAMWPNWFDWYLALYLVEKFPEYKFTFIGATNSPKDEDHGIDTQNLSKHLNSFSNVEFVPEVAHETLLQYFKTAHVGIIPFKINQLTLGCSPLKVFDYLAAGLPVVSSALVQLKDYPYFHYGNTFPEIADELFKTDMRTFRLEDIEIIKTFLDKNTWTYRVEELDEFVNKMLNMPKRVSA